MGTVEFIVWECNSCPYTIQPDLLNIFFLFVTLSGNLVISMQVSRYIKLLIYLFISFPRYGKIVSTKAILDKTTNKCKGMFSK